MQVLLVLMIQVEHGLPEVVIRLLNFSRAAAPPLICNRPILEQERPVTEVVLGEFDLKENCLPVSPISHEEVNAGVFGCKPHITPRCSFAENGMSI